MTKKRKQAVGADVTCFIDEFRTYVLEQRAARWKALAKLYYKKLSGMGIRRRWQTGRREKADE